MTYIKIGNTDFSMYCNSLKISQAANYNAQTNAAGNTVVDYINTKRKIEVGIISLDDTVAKNILQAVQPFSVLISFRNPNTNQLEEDVNCIIPTTDIEYYTIRADKVSYKAMTLKFTEL